MTEPKSLLEKLQDNNYALYFAIVTCLALAPNSYYMFHAFSIIPETFLAREIQAAVVALIISGSILYYTAKKNLDYANKFAYFEFFISCCYYFQSLIMTDADGNPNDVPVWNWHIIPAIAFAFMLPWSVKGYAASIDYGQIKRKTEPKPAVTQNTFKESIATSIEFEIKEPEMRPEIIELIPVAELTTEDLINNIENDEVEDIFSKGSISAIK